MVRRVSRVRVRVIGLRLYAVLSGTEKCRLIKAAIASCVNSAVHGIETRRRPQNRKYFAVREEPSHGHNDNKNLVKFCSVVFELCERTDRQTKNKHRNTAHNFFFTSNKHRVWLAWAVLSTCIPIPAFHLITTLPWPLTFWP